MFKEPTVIVLGAGASIPYGFPSGVGLIDETIKYKNDRGFLEAVAYATQTSAAIDDVLLHDTVSTFVKELNNAHPPSIDTWLFHRREYEVIGKVAMAYHLIRCENAGALMERGEPGSKTRQELWYAEFLHTLGKNPEEIEANSKTLTIVTFNYDRSFEEFAFNKFRAHFGLSRTEAAKLVHSLNIHHVYGQLGVLPWQQVLPQFAQPQHIRKYEAKQDCSDAHYASHKICLIHQVEKECDTVTAIRAAVDSAEFIFLIGFGFHDENIELIGLENSFANIYATDKGLSAPKKERAKERLPNLDWSPGSAADLIYSYLPYANVATGKAKGISQQRREREQQRRDDRLRAHNLHNRELSGVGGDDLTPELIG